MSIHSEVKKVTTATFQKMKKSGEKITMLTAYDYTTARMVDAGGVDSILVGDSAANVMAGHETTLPITLDQMIYHAQGVCRGVQRALVVVDLPFGTYQGNTEKALGAAIRVMKETGAQAIKLEGGAEVAESIQKIVQAGIPVMGHLGLTPQSVNQFGGYGLRAKEDTEAQKLRENAAVLASVGCFAVVLEKIPAVLAQEVSKNLPIPTIGIGAGAGCDGQVLVYQDMVGMNPDFTPKFVRKYRDLHTEVTAAVKEYCQDVKDSNFPNEQESY